MNDFARELIQALALMAIGGGLVCIGSIVSEYVGRYRERRRVRRIMGDGWATGAYSLPPDTTLVTVDADGNELKKWLLNSTKR